MHPDNEEALRARVVRAAEAALAHHQYVSAIDVLIGMGLLCAVESGGMAQGARRFPGAGDPGESQKISRSMAMFRHWARAKELRPSETRYVQRTRAGVVDLQFSASGDPDNRGRPTALTTASPACRSASGNNSMRD